jgi:nucleoside-diphosphate-sugar epimerase
MRVFVAGASGAIGRPLVPMLGAAGHEVTGTTRTREKAAAIEAAGATAVVVDALDAPALRAAVAAAAPEVVVQQLTALPDRWDPRKPDIYDAGGLVLRYGWFYGPGTYFGEGGSMASDVARRRFPVVGKGTGLFSFVHVEDAAAATVGAVEHGAPGVYNVVDDEPAPIREWIPAYAEAIGARRPLRVPVWLARLVTGKDAAAMMTTLPGASNARAKRELGWEPRWPSWRTGFSQAPR